MSASPTQIHDMTLAQLRAGLDKRSFTSRQVVEACLDRIAKADAKLHAFVDVYSEESLALADAADRQRAAGIPTGPLHGLPIAIKDLCDIEGRIGTAGSKAWTQRRATTTATAVRKLLDAGMIPLGKTHMVEFAFGTWGTNPTMGAPWNPWDLKTHRAPGGSSSGSGVAVAAGLAPAAIGSDTGGSVRIPSAMNGIVGLKTTAGRISLHGCIYLSYTLDTLGPMTRSVEDAAMLMQVVAGPDLADPTTLGIAEADYLGCLSEPVAGAAVAVVNEAQLPAVTDADTRRVLAATAEVYAGLGARIKTIRLPDWFFALAQRTVAIIAGEAYHYHRAYIEDMSLPFGAPVRGRMIGGKTVPVADYVQAMRDRAVMREELLRLVGDCSILLMPTCPHPATPLAEIDEAVAPLATYTRAINFLGLCGLSMPAGLTQAGLPLAVQLVGRPFDEPTVLRFGKALQDATPWTGKRPDLSALGL